MRFYACPRCTARVYLDSSACVACGATLAYDPRRDAMRDAAASNLCDNRDLIGCTWTAPGGAGTGGLCVACTTTTLTPPHDDPTHVAQWAQVERAKRKVLVDCFRLGLLDPSQGGTTFPLALRFRFMTGSISAPDGAPAVITGHSDGTITLDVREADDAYREQTRVALGEPVRSLVGHFRHELGHYVWQVLVEPTRWLERFRALFGDETQDYQAALARHYAGPAEEWQRSFISAYAASHPWEDWAESFAHYLHILDLLDTASQYGLRGIDAQDEFDTLLGAWYPLCELLNALNRSMGVPDAYPFTHSTAVVEKLDMAHQLVREHARSRVRAALIESAA